MKPQERFKNILLEAKKQRRGFFWKFVSTRSERVIKNLLPLLARINDLEAQISKLSDSQLSDKTPGFKEKLSRGVTPEEILPEAFAVVREVAKRKIKMRHFDVQILGGIILFQGKIAEMATGEGKTLVATLPLYLTALQGKGAHLVTVNDYLAKRDREWMGPVYESLGLSVGVIQHDLPTAERQRAYNSDITYGTNNEFGFDYLRDNMAISAADRVQRKLHFAIVDEVDSILIDEARTPLIISGPAEKSSEKYYIVDRLFSRLKGKTITKSKEETYAKGAGKDLEAGYDYLANEETQTVVLTEEGVSKCEKLLGKGDLYEDPASEWPHYINQMLRAHIFFNRDDEYMVKDAQVIIVDEFTGRLMPGRRWSDGLHQAIEAKEASEGVKIENENQTLATITFQNYFKLYQKLAGMTGTAFTEAAEFQEIYKLDTVVIPTNKPLIRYYYPDLIYKSEKEKYFAIVKEIEELHKKGRPVLVGTTSVAKNEKLSGFLEKRGVPHQILNAKYHEMEAKIIAKAGEKYAVTIATNMAGRGTDIVLGEGVARMEGLHVIGSERHEARRIDNQLRGRAGRQGDPGSSRFYLSLEDDLMRIFGGERLTGIMNRLPEGQEIQHPLITRAIENAQKRVEGRNFEIRKQLVDFDNVMNEQRTVVYDLRRAILEGEDLTQYIRNLLLEEVESGINSCLNLQVKPGEWDLGELSKWAKATFQFSFAPEPLDERNPGLAQERIKESLLEKVENAYREKEKRLGEELMSHLERSILLQVIDNRWKSHLYDMDALREGIGLRAYGQHDPIVAYKQESYLLFDQMNDAIREETINYLFKVEVVSEEEKRGAETPISLVHSEVGSFDEKVMVAGGKTDSSNLSHAGPSAKIDPYHREGKKIGRNEPCPCGSGKKYKHCCGRK